MTTRLRATVTSLLALLLLAAVATPPLAAQDDAFDIRNLDGIRNAVSRTYAIDVSTLTDMITTPGSELGMPSGPVLMIGLIAEFDTPAHATAAVDAIGEASLAGPADAGPSLDELEWSPVDDLGTSGIAYVGPGTSESLGELGVFVIQDDTWLYVAIVSSTDDSSEATARGLITFALGHAAGTGDSTFRSDGSSGGGLWNKLPSAQDTSEDAEDNVFAGLMPTVDEVIFPIEDAASTPSS